MAKKIDHEQRRRELALKAVELFSKEGYENVSLIDFAAYANIARTILYRYFGSKREILDAGIRATTGPLGQECRFIAREKGPAIERLERVCSRLVDFLFEHRSFLTAVFDFTISMARSGEEMGPRIHTFTHGICDVFEALVREGAWDGSIKAGFDPALAAETLYMGFEAFSMRIALGVDKDPSKASRQMLGMVRAMAADRAARSAQRSSEHDD